ncbi:SusC/RagA family TonB-linked outer membrane protein [Tamlana sp. 2201CG12-4]|uniref:SusC/RagA family TonB-linked outer membrane protein n=1 Tax=Tamlana sp. 2201CG12-4 TaxID=3112582 RepID=UPI002DBACCC5|nr:SusC/RagA family TonB-linked outer membrane protein [Tamlana sp. 2201CG12-4]MEC3906677.1 SusC/RagA family TonB-linked outer membrane protein [Tamlana sp. 2201CG12-4]
MKKITNPWVTFDYKFKFDLKMKLTTLFLMVSLCYVNANSYSQNARITLNLQGVSVNQVLDNIESLSEFKFLFKRKEIDVKRIVSIKVKKQPISSILKNLFEGEQVDYKVFNKQIILNQASNIPNAGYKTVKKDQQPSVTGSVTDQNGQPLPGATIQVKGTRIGVATDFDGKYSLELPDNSKYLVFSYVGMSTQEIEIGTQSVIDVIMKEDASTLNEVVVTALGLKRQSRELGYATQGVSGESLVQASSPDIITALSGQIAGVNISVPDGVEGSSSRIIIRGNNSIKGDNQPLIIIDGVQQSNDFIERDNFSGYTDWGTALNNVNSFDIENLEVLKGPAAAALYGARGSNGVVLITTKKGSKREGLGINYSTRFRITSATRYRDIQNVFGSGGPITPNDSANPSLPVNGDGEFILPGVWGTTSPQHSGGLGLGGRATWADFSWYASGVSWGPRMEGQLVRWWDGELRSFSPQPNNIKEYFRTGTNAEHNISFSDAGSFGSVRVSLTHLDHQSVTPNSDFKQNTINIGSALNISDRLKADVALTYFDYSRKNSPILGDANDSWGKATLYYYPRNYKVLDKGIYENEDGSRNDLAGYGNNYWGNSQYLWWNTYHDNRYLDRKKLLGSLTLNYEATNWLSLMGRIGIEDTRENFSRQRDPVDVFGLLDAAYTRSLTNKSVINTDFLATLRKDNILPNFNASLSLGGASLAISNYGINAARGEIDKGEAQVAYPFQFSFNNVEDGSQIDAEEIFYDKKINSLFSFLDLSYKDYLFLQVTGRNDWSSTLPSSNNSYFYPSANLSFIATDAFDLTNIKWLSFAKLRLAVARTAIDTDPFSTAAIYDPGNFAGNPTVSLPDVIPPINLKPQISDSYEAGLSLGIDNNRFNVDFTYYKTKSFNQILESPVPISSGASSYMFNTGELENKGVEIQFNGRIIDNPNFRWNMSINYARNKNFVVALDEQAEFLELANLWGVYGPSVRVKPGDQYGTIYGYDYQLNENGERLVSDDGHHYLTTDEKVPLGNATPSFVGGINNTLSYKNFSLGINIDTKWGADVFAGTYANSIYNGQAPITVNERLGGGLPFTSTDGSTSNIGVILDGVHANGQPNTTVVHPIWKYVGNYGSAWGDRTALVNGEYENQKFLHREVVIDNSWVKLRQVSLNYTVPKELLAKTKIFQSLNFSLVGRDLLYLYQNMPDNINPEGLTNVGNGQGVEWGALPGFSSFTIGLNASF